MFPSIQTAPTYDGGAVPDAVRLSNKALLGVQGYNTLNRKLNAQRTVQLAEASELWAKFLQGGIKPFLMQEAINPTEDFAFRELNRMAPHIFNEAMTRSDFANLTSYVLDRQMLENYPLVPSTYEQCCRIHNNVRDFRTVERWVTDNAEDAWQKVGETASFNRTKEDTGKYEYKVYKYEKGAQISWEAVINDDMGQFTDLPRRLAVGGKRTIEQFWLNLIAGTTGPKSSFYGTAISLLTGGTINNVIDTSAYGGSNNAPLNIANLIIASGIFMNQMTAQGRPIDIASDQLNVVVADGVLYNTLKNIINTNQIASTILGGSKASSAVTADITMMAKNWISGNINPIYAPELRNIMTSNFKTAWWLFAKPSASRPAVEIGFLNGYNSPTLYKKLPDTVRIGGGGAVDEMGTFETMATEFKGLVVFGGTSMDPRMTMGSNGTGT